MKQILITIGAVLLVGCGQPPPDISIIDAARDGNIEAVKQHIAAGTDVSARHNMGRHTPLYFAVFKGHMEIAELLIANGADVNAKDDNGNTPVDWIDVDDVDSKEIADLLRKHGGKTGEELKAVGK